MMVILFIAVWFLSEGATLPARTKLPLFVLSAFRFLYQTGTEKGARALRLAASAPFVPPQRTTQSPNRDAGLACPAAPFSPANIHLRIKVGCGKLQGPSTATLLERSTSTSAGVS